MAVTPTADATVACTTSFAVGPDPPGATARYSTDRRLDPHGLR